MSLRRQFIQDAQRRTTPIVELCAAYGISRKTGYKWLARYEAGGFPALALLAGLWSVIAALLPHLAPLLAGLPGVIATLLPHLASLLPLFLHSLLLDSCT